MMQLYPDEGLILLCRLVVDNKGEGLTWALYENDIDPNLDSVFADFTLSDQSWGRIIVPESDFTLEQVMLHNGAIQAEKITFTNTTGAPVIIYGFVIVDHVTQKLVAASRDDNAPVTIAAGGEYKMQPILGDYSDVSTPTVDGGIF